MAPKKRKSTDKAAVAPAAAAVAAAPAAPAAAAAAPAAAASVHSDKKQQVASAAALSDHALAVLEYGLARTCAHVWLRAEVESLPPRGVELERAVDRRAPLTPDDAQTLVRNGFRVTVESSPARTFADAEYERAGCELVPAGSWLHNAPRDAVILGLREFALIEQGVSALAHRHVYFSHTFKRQPGWQSSLARYARGGGVCLDLEFLQTASGTRATSFGTSAGFIGMASGIMAWCRQALSAPGISVSLDLAALDKLPLLQHMERLLKAATGVGNAAPRIVIVGAAGIVGRGAWSFAKKLGLDVTEWTREQTSVGGPFPQLLAFDILVNAVRMPKANTNNANGSGAGGVATVQPFLTRELVRTAGRQLSVVVDIACDVSSPNNPLPIYSQSTTFSKPTLRVLEADAKQRSKPLDVIAIPNLPSLLPTDSSVDFSAQILPLLLRLKTEGWQSPVWKRCAELFHRLTRPLRPVMPRSSSTSSAAAALRTTPVPATVKQQRVWTGLQSGAFTLAHALVVDAARVDGLTPAQTEVARVTAAVGALTAQHDLLCAEFAEEKAAQNTGAAAKLTFTQRAGGAADAKALVSVVDAKTEADVVSAVRAAVNPQRLAPSKGVNFHVTLIRNAGAGAGAVVVVVFHPLVADAQSARLFVHQLVAALSSASASTAKEAVSFGDFAVWQAKQSFLLDVEREVGADSREPDASVVPRQALSYWRTELDDSAPVVQVPTDFSRTVDLNFVSARRTLPLAADLTAAVRAYAAKHQAVAPGQSNGRSNWTLYSLFLTAYYIVLYRRTKESDLVVSTPVSGRSRHVLRRAFGPLASQLCVRVGLDDRASFTQLFDGVRAKVLRGLGGAPADLSFDQFTAAQQQHGAKAGAAAAATRTIQPHPTSVAYAQVQFVMAPSLTDDVDAVGATPLPAGVSVRDLDGAAGAQVPLLSPMDLTFGVSPTSGSSGNSGGLTTWMEYNPKLFSADAIDETLQQLHVLLQQATAPSDDGTRSILSYSLLTAVSRPRVPDASAPLDAGWAGPIPDCFERMAVAHPASVAVAYKDERVTYAALRAATNRLANALRAAGMGKGSVVGLYGHRSPAVVWAIMGILKAGCAYTMMDPKYPADRIICCVDIAGISGWIAVGAAGTEPAELQAHLKALKLKFQLTLPSLTDASVVNGQFLSAHSTDAPQGVVIAQPDVAVVTFTSGSTGIPKGVMGCYSSLTHFYPWMATRFGLSAADRFSMCSGIAHDPLQRDIFTPLFFGASIWIPTEEDIAEPGQLARWFAAHAITVTCLTPAMGQLLTSADRPDQPLTALRRAFFVGDCLIKRDVLKLKKFAPNVHCINMYGSTETQRAVGHHVITDEKELATLKEVIPVGEGMADVQCLIINSAGVLAGVGELAEIYVRSPHLAKGYIGLDGASGEKFLPNPFHPARLRAAKQQAGVGARPAAAAAAAAEAMDTSSDAKAAAQEMDPAVDRMYRTGDLGRYNVLGGVECSGRADDQIKIRGFRIELGEINAFLSKHAFVKENVTVMREDKPGHKELISYVVPTDAAPKADVKPNSADVKSANTDVDTRKLSRVLREHLRAHLPSYMVPSAIVILQCMPLTPNGKINRPGLPKPDRSAYGGGGADDAAAGAANGTAAGAAGGAANGSGAQHVLTALEQTLVRVWSSVLGVSAGPADNFFDLGGHSLLATQLTLEMRRAVGPALADAIQMNMLFECPTVSAFAAALTAKTAAKGSAAAAATAASAPAFDLAGEPARVLASIAFDPKPKPYAFTSDPRAVLLTGATGFLGAFLLAELLRKTNATVYCGVRARNADTAFARVKDSLTAHQQWDGAFAARIVAVPADLALPNLGLSDAQFGDLAERVDLIVHNGAVVHWVLPYAKLRATNVHGTAEVLRLAGLKRVKAVHFVSTTSTYDDDVHAKQTTPLLEDDDVATCVGMTGGYPQSKWVAERLCILARTKGLPVTVYRPAYITGHSVSGVWNTDDFLCRLIKGCIQLRACPFADAHTSPRIDMAPVDFVASAVVALALQASSANRNFNVNNPNGYSYHALFSKFRSFGYDLQPLPYAQWRQRLLQSVEAQTSPAAGAAAAAAGAGAGAGAGASAAAAEPNALFPILSQFSAGWADGLVGRPKADNSKAVAALLSAQPPVRVPVIDSVVFAYLSYLIGCRFLAPPESAPTNQLQIDWKVIGEGVSRLSRTNRS